MGSTIPDRWPTVLHVEDWQAIGIVCGALLAALTLLGVLDRKVVRPMWRSFKTAARLLEQLTGDKDRGVPSLMEQIATVVHNQDEQGRQIREQGRQMREHLESPHPSPSWRPPVRPNSMGGGRHLDHEDT